jgi:hypothetical protein
MGIKLTFKKSSAAAIIFIIAVTFQTPGCIRQLAEHKMSAVPPGCADCHDAVSDITGKTHPDVKKGDFPYCRTCHIEGGDASLLSQGVHLDHLPSPDFSGNCRSCHFTDEAGGFGVIGDPKKTTVPKGAVENVSPYFYSWADSRHLDHTHAKNGVNCTGCHETAFPDDGLSLEECLKCHGSYEDLAAATKKVEPNPHDAHYTDLRCTLCHKGHTDSVLYCNSCHEFDLDVP